MIRQIKKYKITCDNHECNNEEIVESCSGIAPLPQGWQRQQKHDCGLTGYTRSIVLCSTCVVRCGSLENRSL